MTGTGEYPGPENIFTVSYTSSLFAGDVQVKIFLCRPGQILKAPGGCGS